jgi:Ca2+-transporting ATPase
MSTVQGLVIAGGVLLLYYYFMQQHSLEETRTAVFTLLIASNIFLTFVNRSFTQSFLVTIHYKNNLALLVLIISVVFLLVIHLVPAVRNLFELSVLTPKALTLSILIAFLSTAWFELYKMIRSK